jgi:hypothetical protein
MLQSTAALSVLALESALILGEELVEGMEQDPIEDGLLGLTRAEDSRHIGKEGAKNGPLLQAR